MIMAVLTADDVARDPARDVQVGSLIHFHQRLGHISYDTIERIGGVICSDLKGPLMPKDLLGNRHLVNFVDHKSNYCRVFLTKSKDQAAKKFKHFLAFFERRLDILVLRTDGRGEYRNFDLFCQANGVARQISEARN